MAKTYLISRTCVFTVYIDQESDAESEEEALEKFEEMENHGDFDHERIEDIVNHHEQTRHHRKPHPRP